jgi:glycosyltransferase involved in cell wall biosynthesis
VNLAFVVPRYGEEVVGGAELAARMLAERLVTRDGVDVEVLTTRAIDSRTWATEYPEGEVTVRGVRVRRFSASPRSPEFDRESAPVLSRPEVASPALESRWLDLQGPVSNDLIGAVRDSSADLIVFSPYLFHSTVRGVAAVEDRAVLHPAAHDEAVLRLPMYRAVFERARALVCYTHAEQRLVWSRFRVARTPQVVLGLGVEARPGAPEAAVSRLGIRDRPYVLCLGRVEGAKGTDALARAFAAFKDRHPGPFALVYAGPVADLPPAHHDIVVAGLVDDETKWGLLRGATALISPSPYESFGLVVLEAWVAGTPVLVNASCEATREHCERSGGGLWFRDYEEFEVALRRVIASSDLRASLAGAGGSYARTRFAWPALTDRYVSFLATLDR